MVWCSTSCSVMKVLCTDQDWLGRWSTTRRRRSREFSLTAKCSSLRGTKSSELPRRQSVDLVGGEYSQLYWWRAGQMLLRLTGNRAAIPPVH